MAQHEMGLAEAAFELGISYNMAHNLVLTRQLVGHRVGQRWRVDRESVQAYRDARNGAAVPASA